MPNSNAFLLSLVNDAQTICVEKFNIAKTTSGAGVATLISVGSDMERIFAAVGNPDIWSATIDADSEPIVEQIIVLGSMDGSQPDEVLSKIAQMLQLIEVNILKPGMESTDAEPTTSGMNLQVLDALRLTRQQIGMKLRSFALAGEDLTQNPTFQTMMAQQDTLVKTYREQLKDNKIVSKQTDVIIIKRLGDLISASETTHIFKTNYSKLSDFIQLKLGPTS